MAHRKRRAHANTGRPRQFSSTEPPPQTRRSPRPLPRSPGARDFDVFAHRRSTFAGSTPPFPQRLRAQSDPEGVSSFKASIHSNPYFASRCRMLKLQTTHLKQKLEDLLASVEELQPDQSAMDWSASAATIVYVPVRVTRDNEAPRASPAHTEVRRPEGGTFPDSSQYGRGMGDRGGEGVGADAATSMGRGETQQQPQPQPQPQRQAQQSGWRSEFRDQSFAGDNGGQAAMASNLETGDNGRDSFTVPPRASDQPTRNRHAYVEDSLEEEEPHYCGM